MVESSSEEASQSEKSDSELKVFGAKEFDK